MGQNNIKETRLTIKPEGILIEGLMLMRADENGVPDEMSDVCNLMLPLNDEAKKGLMAALVAYFSSKEAMHAPSQN